MITFKKLGTHGRLGNQLWQIAFMIGLAKKHDLVKVLPAWKYSEYFENPVTSDIPADQLTTTHKLEEQHFHYTPKFWDQYADEFRNKKYDITCWGQSEKYFEDYKVYVHTTFQFKDSFKKSVIEKMPSLMEEGKSHIAISVRQGDYVGNPNYELIPIKFYLMALFEYFPDFRKDAILHIFSDDIQYCKLHFGCLDNVVYAEGMSDIEQLCAGSMCDHAIIANSTFSWWMAWLIEYGLESITKIICPNFLFKGAMAKTNDSSDFYPERWIKLDHKIKRIDLKNTTFTIPVYMDSRDRKQNVDLSIKYLRENFDTNITVGEQGHQDFSYLKDIVDYRFFEGMADFHRTKMLNDMAGDAKTPVVVNWDGDIIISPLQIVEATRAIVEDKQEMVYPYDGRFARVARHTFYQTLEERMDVGCLSRIIFNGMRSEDPPSVGGAIFWDSMAFLRSGLENENMVSYGPEDAERYDRATMLGVKIHRIPGVLYHIDHIQSINSSVKHPKYPDNVTELEKIRSLTKLQLETYIDTWSWARKYTPSYYESIFEESVKSRDIVFGLLHDLGYLDGRTIIDVGCGLGQWGFDVKEKFGVAYKGIDFGVPQHKLKIPNGLYIDHDLREPIAPGCTRFGLAICLEVGEHLPKESADQLIDTLTLLSDTILFSAAIPAQGGLDHINEQWQSWWAEKFIERGYRPHHCDIRDEIWGIEDVGVWYRQNMILYEKDELAHINKALYPLDRIHPQMYMNLMKHYRILK
jgi:hypothetical protein